MFGNSYRLNNQTYIQYYNRLTELAISMFEWKGLPDSVDQRFLEMMLFSDGMVVFFYDEVLGYLTLQCMIAGKLTVYRIPRDRNAYAPNGYNRKLDDKNSVIIFNNYLHTNSMLDVEMFAERLYNFDRIIDVNANAQKTPVLINCDENQRLTMKNLYEQYDGNQPFIFGSKNLDVKGLSVLKTDAPYVADKIYTLKTQYWNEALTYLGITNTNTVKKERMITDEVDKNDGVVVASRFSRLEMRRQACREINKMFNLNISVDYRSDREDTEQDNTQESEVDNIE